MPKGKVVRKNQEAHPGKGVDLKHRAIFTEREVKGNDDHAPRVKEKGGLGNSHLAQKRGVDGRGIKRIDGKVRPAKAQ